MPVMDKTTLTRNQLDALAYLAALVFAVAGPHLA
jgi:hypothetical protein